MSYFAGCRTFEIAEQASGGTLPLLIMYPSLSEEFPVRMGPYEFSAAKDAPLAGGTFPLVLISHGSRGSHLVYRTLAAHLARNGFIVVTPEHPRDNRNDASLMGTVENLVNRPLLVRQVLDWMSSSREFAMSLNGATAMIGHSMGGYTALAVAGGRPTAFAKETEDGTPREVETVSDARVKALVLLAPATPWFMNPGALAQVRLPVQLWSAEKDTLTTSWHSDIVREGIGSPELLEDRMVANGGHFSFLSAFPETMCNPGFPPSQDPPGFDRAAFHELLHREVVDFLRRVL